MSHNTTTNKSIIIVDDHPVMRLGLSSIINQDENLSVCAEADAQHNAIELIAMHTPDVAIIDLSLKTGSGLELIKHVRSYSPHTRSLVLSTHDAFIYAERAIQAGAMGYINKQAEPKTIIDGIHAVLSGEIYVNDKLSEAMLNRVNNPKQLSDDTGDYPTLELSNREIEVLYCIGKGLPTKAIAKKLFVSIKTVETHRGRIKKKLGLESGVELNRYAIMWVMEQTDSNPTVKYSGTTD